MIAVQIRRRERPPYASAMRNFGISDLVSRFGIKYRSDAISDEGETNVHFRRVVGASSRTDALRVASEMLIAGEKFGTKLDTVP